MVKIIKDSDFNDAIATGISVVDISAEWCGPCKMLAPIVEELSEEMDDIKFYNMDADNCPDTARKLRVMSIPAIYVFKDGEEVANTIGFQPKDTLKEFIEQCR